jgi:hypothetical protein
MASWILVAARTAAAKKMEDRETARRRRDAVRPP